MSCTIALVGNPNSGKTTLFNQMTGNHQYTGNWPGVTVERKTGNLRGDTSVQFVDLPGIYSLLPYSADEVVARNFLEEGSPDAIIDCVDASNLERNLYLTTQLMEFGVPVVVALNQMDIVRKRGYTIKSKELEKVLGVPVVEISALKGEGIAEVVKAATDAASAAEKPKPVRFSAELETYLKQVEDKLPAGIPADLRRYHAIKFFERDQEIVAEHGKTEAIDKIIIDAESKFDDASDAIITNERFKFIEGFISRVHKRAISGLTRTEAVDRIVLNRVAAIPIFVAVIALIYYISISTVGTIATDWVNDGVFGEGFYIGAGQEQLDEAQGAYDEAQGQIGAFLAAAEEKGVDTSKIATYVGENAEEGAELDSSGGKAALAQFSAEAANVKTEYVSVDEETGEAAETPVDFDTFTEALSVPKPEPSAYGFWVPSIPTIVENGLNSVGCADWLKDLILNGIIAGVGAVLGFVPQIMILFFLLAILEGCGYMARVTFILDRLFRRFGLSGKTFIPMIVGTGCGVPGIMASRTIESEASRHLTVMTTTFMPCSAKLPIIALIATAFFGGAWWVAPFAYFLGIFSIVISGIMLRKTKPFIGETTPYIMELPEYRLPRFVDLLRSMWERAWAFIKKAGTVILAATIIVWFLSGYGFENGAFGAVTDSDNSLLAAFGNAIAWIFIPLGWGNWEAASTTITGFLAKENLVGTMAVLYGGDPSVAWTTTFAAGLAELNGSVAALGTAAAFSFMVFNLLCAPCFAAMGAIKREMGGFNKWFWAALGYECGYAWVMATIIFQLSAWAITGTFTGFTLLGIALLAFILFMLFRPFPKGREVEGAAASVAAAGDAA